MIGNTFKEAPYIEVLNSSVSIDMMPGCALAQAKQPEFIRVRATMLRALTQSSEISMGDFR